MEADVFSGTRMGRVRVLAGVLILGLASLALVLIALANPDAIGTPVALTIAFATLIPLAVVLRKTCWRLTLTDSGILAARLVGGTIPVSWNDVSGIRVFQYRTIISHRRALRISLRGRPRIDVFAYMFGDFDLLCAAISRRGVKDEHRPSTLFERLWFRSVRH